MSAQTAILLLVMFVGALSRNQLLVRASCILLAVNMLGWTPALDFLEREGLDLGILLLTVAVLSPLASGHTGLHELATTFLSPSGAAALAAGALAAVLTGQGVTLLRTRPEVVMGLACGSIFGAAFLGGVPAGPLVAAGFAAVLLRALGRF
jgi:uncharacterized membrane protein (DUF441 family)